MDTQAIAAIFNDTENKAEELSTEYLGRKPGSPEPPALMIQVEK